MNRIARVLIIAGVTACFGWLGVWIGGPRGSWEMWELEESNFFHGRNLLELSQSPGMYPSKSVLDESFQPPCFPSGIPLLECYEHRKGDVSGATFSVTKGDRAKVLEFYRSLLQREGWNEIPTDTGAATSGTGCALAVFRGRGEIFFLGSETAGAVARFVTTRMPQAGE